MNNAKICTKQLIQKCRQNVKFADVIVPKDGKQMLVDFNDLKFYKLSLFNN